MSVVVTRRRFLAGAMGLPIVLAGAARPLAACTAGVVHEVAIEGLRFHPADITVHPGDKVRWTNRDLSPHTATALDGSWDTGELKLGESAEIVIGHEKSGGYFCAYHPMMRGKIAVS